MANKMTDTTSSLNDCVFRAIAKTFVIFRGHPERLGNFLGAEAIESLTKAAIAVMGEQPMGGAVTNVAEEGSTPRSSTQTLIQKIEAMLERSPNNHPCREDWETTINVIRRVEANEPSEIPSSEVYRLTCENDRLQNDLDNVRMQRSEILGNTVDAHVEFWKAEYKSLARAGVERMAEFGYQVDPAEKMIEAAEYREKMILGKPREPKRESVAQWQSIETAPYGVEILVCCLYSDGKRINTIANATRSHDDDDRDYWDGIDGIMDVKDLRFWMPITPLNSIEDEVT